MKLQISLSNVILFINVLGQIDSYVEKRTFRERSNIFCRLNKQCKQYEIWDADYKELMNISDVAGIQPDNYLVRFPFYILAERDAQIVFTETDNPDWFADNVYEIVFGGWENKRTTLNRKHSDNSLIFTYTDEILARNCPLKVLVEITTAGEIRVYVEHQIKPIIEFKDSNPLKIKYFGFSSMGQSLARFFYDCRGDEIYSKTQLKHSCNNYETAESEFKQFTEIQTNLLSKSDGRVINLPLFIEGRKDAHILISSDDAYDKISDAYEIVIGDHMNRRISIQSIHDKNTSMLADYRRADLLSTNETLNVFIRISKTGKIDIFSKHDHTQYKMLASVKDPKYNPTSLKYFSLSSYNNTHLNYFYSCAFPPAFIDIPMATKYASVGHPLLLEDPDFEAPIDKRNWLTSRCKYYTNTKYEYRDFFKLSDIQDSQPSGFQARLSFYAQGTRNAHVLLSRTANPNVLVDNVYEFVIGGWVNSRVLIRRKKSDQVLQQVFVAPILTAQSPTKFVIEIANSGNIRIYSENDKLEPIAAVFDPVVLPVKYVSFCAYDNLVKFYYDCRANRL